MLIFSDKLIPNASHGLDMLGMVGILLDFFAKVPDMDVDSAGLAHVVVAPDFLQEGVPGVDAVAVGGQQVEELE